MTDKQIIAVIKKRGVPPLYSQENNTDPIVYIEFILYTIPGGWYVTECEIEEDERDILFFGYVKGDENEWRRFRLSELKAARCCAIIPNIDFAPMPFSQLKKKYDL